MSNRLSGIHTVVAAELEEIRESRKVRLGQEEIPRQISDSSDCAQDQLCRAGKSQLLGLAFSGGGIRSATFNLGVLQALAKLGLLRRFDYLSTVSGGGYIGSWLVAWLKRRTDFFAKKDGAQQNPEGPPAERALQDVIRGLDPDRQRQAGNPEPKEIRWLRQYSNYLTPRLGLASGDTWAVVGSYLRNLLLNQIILFLVLIALLLVALVPTAIFRSAHQAQFPNLWLWAFGILAITITTIVANVSALLDLERVESWTAPQSFAAGPFVVHLLGIFPVLAGSWALWAWWWKAGAGFSDGKAALWGAFFYAGLWALGWSVGSWMRLLKAAFQGQWSQSLMEGWKTAQQLGLKEAGSSAVIIVVSAGVAGAVGGWLLAQLRSAISAVAQGEELTSSLATHFWQYFEPSAPFSSTGIDHEWHAAFWGIPFVIVIFLLVEVLHIGLVGKRFSEEVREWLARLGGLILLWTLCGSLLTLIAMDGPRLIAWLLETFKPEAGWIKWGLASVWAAITGAGILAGKSSKTDSENSSRTLELAGKIAPPVFILGLLLLLSIGIHNYLPAVLQVMPDFLANAWAALPAWLKWLAPAPASSEPYWSNVEVLSSSASGMCVLAILIAWFLSSRVGINEFSMHGFYRNRLVRCYLGASRAEYRQPQPFTGFDPTDDFDLADLANSSESEAPTEASQPEAVAGFLKQAQQLANRSYQKVRSFLLGSPEKKKREYCGPYPIINAALNLVSGEELAWQRRKAASFMLTPRYCGYAFCKPKGGTISAFQETRNGHVSMGLAVATSGAAASPNMGYHSSPALAFLMTVFNVRLGWWMGNPRFAEKWERAGPLLGLFYLLCELFGQTDEKRNFVYVSDGGHFENLGIYELVRRRCQFIVACDASEDHETKFGDLGNAIEKCRTDFGVDIEIDIEPLRRDKESGKSQWHCAVGDIHYEKLDRRLPRGTILYLKPSLTGNEPTDVERYAAENPAFPHHSTADQFFDESQFESYRMLGQHIGKMVFETAADEKEWASEDLQRLFVLLSERWYPPSEAGAASFTKHAAAFMRLVETMRKDPDLAFLHQQVYPEWSQLMNAKPAVYIAQTSDPGTTLWLPPTERERRAGFYFCNQMIQLMEDVYVDLNLEEEFDHPDNRGWMNLFYHWSWSGMFSATWAISAGTYGARFQRFCERRLDLRLGKVEIGKEFPLDNLEAKKDEHLLNSWELQLIEFFRKNSQFAAEESTPVLERLRVFPLQIVVRAPDREDEKDTRMMRFTFGFVLAEIQRDNDRKTIKIRYLRVQDHLRKMGLARQALRQLVKDYKKDGYEIESAATWFSEDKKLEILSRKQISVDASLEEALPTREDAVQFQRLFDAQPPQAQPAPQQTNAPPGTFLP